MSQSAALMLLLCFPENDDHLAAQHTVTASLLIAAKLINGGKFTAPMRRGEGKILSCVHPSPFIKLTERSAHNRLYRNRVNTVTVQHNMFFYHNQKHKVVNKKQIVFTRVNISGIKGD